MVVLWLVCLWNSQPPTSMAPGRSVKNVAISVPRHNAQRTGLKLAAEIKRQARSKKLLVDINMPHPELNVSIVSLSLLISPFEV